MHSYKDGYLSGSYVLRYGGSWRCPSCDIENQADRTDCRICTCPRENICCYCKKPNEDDARFCRFCGKKTVFNAFHVFDLEGRSDRIKSSRETDRKYRELGYYYQWEDGPYEDLEDSF